MCYIFRPQAFHFPLTDEEANTLSLDTPNTLPKSSTKLLVGVYPRNVSEDLAANLSLPLEDVKLSEPPETVIAPPVSRGEEFEVEWDRIGAGVSGSPVEYPLTVLQEKSDSYDSDEDDQENPPLIPILCHRVKVQRYYTITSVCKKLKPTLHPIFRYQYVESGDSTQPWEE